MSRTHADLRIFSYLPNPRVWKATIAARLCGVNVEVVGAPADELPHWLWDFDARLLSDADRIAMMPRAAQKGLGKGMLHKSEAFLEAHPFGTVPAAFSPDGTIGIFESNSIMRLVGRLGEARTQLSGDGPYLSSRVDSFLDASLAFSIELQRYILALRSRDNYRDAHRWAGKALETYLSGIEHALRPDRSYLVGRSVTIADICFVCDLAILANESLHAGVLARDGLKVLASSELALSYPLGFAHFSKLCREAAFAPDLVTYRDKLALPPFHQAQAGP